MRESKRLDVRLWRYSCVRTDLKAIFIDVLKNATVKDYKDENDFTPLHIATQDCFYDGVISLLELKDTKVTSRDKYGRTPLEWAITQGDLRMVHILLQHEPSLANNLDLNGCSPLYLACKLGVLDVARTLINNFEVHDNNVANDGTCIFYWPCKRGDLEIVRLLVFHGYQPVNLDSLLRATFSYVTALNADKQCS